MLSKFSNPPVYLCSAFIVLILISSHCGSAHLLDVNRPYQHLGYVIDYLQETNKALSLEEVLAPDVQSLFRHAEGPNPNFGIVNGGYWFRVSIDLPPNSERFVPRLLELEYPFIDHIEFYTPDGKGSYLQTVTGDSYPFAQRSFSYHSFVFETRLSNVVTNHLYFRIKTSTSLQMPLILWQPKEFIESVAKKRLGLGILYGSILAMLFYNLFIYISVKDRSYFYYLLYISTAWLALTSVDGIAFEFLWPGSPFLANMSIVVLVYLVAFFATLFAKDYLSLESFSPKLNFLAKLFMYFAVLGGVTAWFSKPSIALAAGMVLIILNTTFLMVIGVYGIYRRQRRAYFFTGAWFLLCFGALLKAATVLGYFTPSILTLYGNQVGAALELILLSLGLADRMNQDRSERLEAINLSLSASEQKREAERRLLQHSLFDSLSGHPKRSLCLQQLNNSIEKAQQERSMVAIVCIHLNSFHEINNTLGHNVGDAIIVQFVKAFNQQLEKLSHVVPIEYENISPKYVSLIDGVYFGVIFNYKLGEGISDTIKSIHEICAAPMVFQGMALTLGGHTGLAIYPDHGDHSDMLLRKAMVAVRAAKKTRTAHRVYSECIDLYNEQRLTLMGELKAAIANNQLELFFQPKFSFKSRRVVSLEALLRWNHPVQGLLGPDQFIGLAESTGIIRPLTQWVLENALGLCAELNHQGYDISVAINISARNLLEEDFVERVSKTIDDSRLLGTRLVLEVVESSMIEDIEHNIRTLKRLERLGIQLAIDDFGTGYSSLEYLKKLPVHELKIDRSFVSDMFTDTDDRLIVSTTLAMAHQLGKRVVAEGIENLETMELLNEMGCDIAQGYYISRPMRRDDLVEFLQ